MASSWAFSREASDDHSLNQLELLAHLADGPIYLAIDDVIDIAASPLVGQEHLVVDVGEAGFESPAGQRLDRRAEAALVTGLAGLVFGSRHGGGCARRRNLCQDESGGRQAGDGGSKGAESWAHNNARRWLAFGSRGSGDGLIWGWSPEMLKSDVSMEKRGNCGGRSNRHSCSCESYGRAWAARDELHRNGLACN